MFKSETSDVVGEQKSGWGQVWAGFGDQHFRDVPLGFLGFRGSTDVGVGSGSAFRGRVRFGDQIFGDLPLGFQVSRPRIHHYSKEHVEVK